jgi:hypothetical protein
MEDLINYQKMRIEALENELIKKDAQLLKTQLELTEAKHLLNGDIRVIEVEEALSL